MTQKNPTVNLALNLIIFLLAGIIIYLTYSISINLSGDEAKKAPKQNTQVAAEVIQVEILNGCGVSGIADRFTDFLRANGFDVVNRGNYKTFDLDNTIIIDRRGNIANAKKTAKILGAKPSSVIQQLNEDYFLDVTIIVGKDYYNLIPLK
ncbi:MAG: LytR C-terminal domain-containing protein [Bacteroidetes bacterium]|nr:LytR C-terminal domain-containing protein [Bacteroidota bacterium]